MRLHFCVVALSVLAACSSTGEDANDFDSGTGGYVATGGFVGNTGGALGVGGTASGGITGVGGYGVGGVYTGVGGYGVGGTGTGGWLETGGSGGAFGTGGEVSTGGWLGVGGTSSGGTASGGASSGGASSGGTSSGGASSGGTSSGGTANTGGTGGADPNFMIFLTIGQSNMEGVPKPEAQDTNTDSRIKVLAYNNCSNLGRTYDKWYTATPPLHSCYAGLGPADHFSKKLAAAFPNATIGIVPNAISGVDIDFFRKGVTSTRRNEFQIPPDNHWGGAYEWVISRAKIAQQSGVIRGIIFHQGESDTGNAQWVSKVKGMVADLRADLGLGNVPFIAGELLVGGCCAAAHNPLVNQLPGQITNAFVVSSSGLQGQDQYHFNLAGQRTIGDRYGDKMIQALGQ